MRALFLRFYKFTGKVGLLMVLGGILMTPLEIIVIISDGWGALGSSLGIAVRVADAVVVAIVAIMVAIGKYKRSSRTVSHADILFPLVQSEREYCLVLRPFGRDGEVIVPKASRKGRVGIRFTYFARNATMEQIVATAARETLNLATYGIVDQMILLAPPGVTFIRAPNSEWKTVVQCLIRRAHTIVLILHPEQEIRDGFAWEIEQIVRYGMQSRVIIALPPCDSNDYDHQAALLQACIILALLDDSGRYAELNNFKVREYELRLDPATLLVKYKELSQPTWWAAKVGNSSQQESTPLARRREKRKNRKQTVVADGTYLPGFVEAFKTTEHELSELSFKARYPPG